MHTCTHACTCALYLSLFLARSRSAPDVRDEQQLVGVVQKAAVHNRAVGGPPVGAHRGQLVPVRSGSRL